MKTKLFLAFTLPLLLILSACGDSDAPEPITVPAPQGITAVASEEFVTISWLAVDDAALYNVYRSTDGVSYQMLAENVETTVFVDNEPAEGDNYYAVTAVVGGVESAYSDVAEVTWEPLTEEGEWIDPDFALVLQAKGYIADAATVTKEEVAAITELDVSNSSLTSLKGIEYFTSLQVLSCYWNQLTELDVTKNTELTQLFCYRNQLTHLDVSHLTKLTWLYCTDNDIEELDLTNSPELDWLWCSGNALSELDLSHNGKLRIVSCYSNGMTRLLLADRVKDLDCSDNQLEELDVSNNTVLESLACSENKLTRLNLTGATALESLDCTYNLLTQLDISTNTQLEELYCFDNPGAEGLFRVKAWFDNSSVPAEISGAYGYESSWSYNGSTVTLYYYK